VLLRVTTPALLRKIAANRYFMKPLSTEKIHKLCRRCNKNYSQDIICPACKNELIALYDNKLCWRTAYEVEKISRKAMLYTRDDADDNLY